MKVGDLLCYNVGGMRNKTVGIYLGKKKGRIVGSVNIKDFAVVFWLKAGRLMPRGYAYNGDSKRIFPYVRPDGYEHRIGVYFYDVELLEKVIEPIKKSS